MKLRNKLFAGLALFTLLLAGCNSGGSSSGEGNNPPVSEETYTITWKNYDGSVLETDMNVAYGSTPSYDGPTPAKSGTAQYSYAFSGWSPSVSQVTGDATYTAQFSDSVNSYTVTWKNWDGSVLETDTNVAYGSTPTYDGTTPTRANADGFSYTFSGWSPSLSVVRNDVTYTATYSRVKIGVNLTITYSLYNPKTNRLIKTYTNKPNDMGNVSVSGTYDFNAYVDLFADPNEGYTFDGWYYGGLILSSDHNYKYMMWDQDITLEARFKYTTYSLHIFANHNENGLIMIKNGNHNTYVSEDTTNQYYTESVTIAAYSKNDTRFLGWYDKDNNLISTNAVYTFNMSNSNIDIEARWNYFTITYSLNGGTNAVSNPTSYTVEDTISLSDPSKKFNTFAGWYLNDKKIETIVLGTTGDLTIEAKWSQTDEQKAEEEKQEQEELRRLGDISLSDDGKTVTYGLYPQKNVNDLSLVSALGSLTAPESNGWYLYEGNYYAKLKATPYESSYKFDNGTAISNDITYWFKCEPIVWNVLSNNNGEYYIVSSILLDAHCYYNSASNRRIDGQTVYPNNYKHSDIRAWLNNDFYNSAFALGNNHIQTTIVDNSAATTDKTSNSYACAKTEDKVFLPSYKDYINSSYGFSTSTDTRFWRTTDWARARGAYYSDSDQYKYFYWTRSPCGNFSDFAWSVHFDGNIYGNFVTNAFITVRPGLSIKIA